MQTTISQRIKILRSHFNDTADKFGARIKYAPATIRSWEYGQREPLDRAIADICEKTGCNLIWLSEGTGEMFSPAHVYDDINGDINEIFATKPKSSIMSQIRTALDEMKKYQKAAEERSLFIEELLGKSQGNRNASIAA